MNPKLNTQNIIDLSFLFVLFAIDMFLVGYANGSIFLGLYLILKYLMHILNKLNKK